MERASPTCPAQSPRGGQNEKDLLHRRMRVTSRRSWPLRNPLQPSQAQRDHRPDPLVPAAANNFLSRRRLRASAPRTRSLQDPLFPPIALRSYLRFGEPILCERFFAGLCTARLLREFDPPWSSARLCATSLPSPFETFPARSIARRAAFRFVAFAFSSGNWRRFFWSARFCAGVRWFTGSLTPSGTLLPARYLGCTTRTARRLLLRQPSGEFFPAGIRTLGLFLPGICRFKSRLFLVS